MTHYKQFIFEAYEFNEATKTLQLRYSLDDTLHFTETYRFNFKERSTVFTPVVAFGTKTTSSSSTPRRGATAFRDSSRRFGSLYVMKTSGRSETYLCMAKCFSSITLGFAPSEPWFRGVNEGEKEK